MYGDLIDIDYSNILKDEVIFLDAIILSKIDKFTAINKHLPTYLIISKQELRKLMNSLSCCFHPVWNPDIDDLINRFGAIGKYRNLEIKVVINSGKFIEVA